MTGLIDVSRVKGSIHDLERIMALEADDCNLLFVSSRTLAILADLCLDAGFPTRYAATWLVGGQQFIPAGTDDELDAVAALQNRFGLEVAFMNCDELLNAIRSIASAISAPATSATSCEVGSQVDIVETFEGGSLPEDVAGISWFPATGITDRKCKAANYIHQSLRNIIQVFIDNNLDTYTGLGLSFMLAMVAGLIGTVVAGPLGGLAGAIFGAFLAITGTVFEGFVDLDVLLAAILADESAAVCALYSSSDTDGARADYGAYLTANGAGVVEVTVANYILSNSVLSLLYFAYLDSELVIGNVTVEEVCTGCDTCQETQILPLGDGGGGTITPLGGGVFLLEGDDEGTVDGNYRASLCVNLLAGFGVSCGPQMQMSVDNIIGGPFLGGTVGFQMHEDDGFGGYDLLYGAGVPWVGNLTGRYCVFVGSGDFSVEVTVIDI